MYCSLGDIIFNLLIGPSKIDDTKKTIYAKMPLIEGKPSLQRIGEELQEVNITIQFKDAFCIPETQYAALEKKRLDGEVLTFIWGSGDIEGDFVIETHKKNIDELNANGTWQSITCDLTLIEVAGSNKVNDQRKTFEKAAFATTLDAPHPANIQVTEPSPATDVMDDVQGVNIQTDQVASGMDKAAVQAAVKNTAIDKAQEFVDQVNYQSYQLSQLITNTGDLLGSVGIKMAASTNMQTIAPLLTAQVAATTTIMNDAGTLVSGYGALPNPVNNLTDANTVLGVMQDTVDMVTDLKQALADLKRTSQPLAAAIATRKNV